MTLSSEERPLGTGGWKQQKSPASSYGDYRTHRGSPLTARPRAHCPPPSRQRSPVPVRVLAGLQRSDSKHSYFPSWLLTSHVINQTVPSGHAHVNHTAVWSQPQLYFLIDLITPNLYQAELTLYEALRTVTLMSCLIHNFRAPVINYMIDLRPGFTTQCSEAPLGFWRMPQPSHQRCLSHSVRSVYDTYPRSQFCCHQGQAEHLEVWHRVYF